MKLSQLQEAGMSRRNFLKFLGKAGAATAGAPLGKLEKLGFPKIDGLIGNKNVPVRIEFFPDQALMFKNGNNLSSHLGVVSNAFALFKKLISGNKVYDYQDYGQYMLYSKGVADPLKLAQRLGLKKTGLDNHGLWDGIWSSDIKTPFGYIQVTEVGAHNDRWDYDPVGLSNVEIENWEIEVENPIASYWNKNKKDFMGFSNLKLDQRGLQQLEDSGINAEEVVQRKQDWNEKQDVYEKQRRDREEKEYYRSKDKSTGREVGHEKQNQFDPESSRPAQALGQFESKLNNKLIKI